MSDNEIILDNVPDDDTLQTFHSTYNGIKFQMNAIFGSLELDMVKGRKIHRQNDGKIYKIESFSPFAVRVS